MSDQRERYTIVSPGWEPRVILAGVRGRPGSMIVAAGVDSDGRLVITLDDGTQVVSDPINRPWGSIQGDITDQSDLMGLLADKVDGGTFEQFQQGMTQALAEKLAIDVYNQFVLDVADALAGKVGDDDPRLSDSRTPTGGAGGVLSGSYPNPGFAVDMATQQELDAAIATRTTPAEAAASAPVQTVQGRTGNVTVTKADLSIENVDNTSDLDKPVSTLQQQALDTKVDKVEGKGLSTNDLTDPLYDKLVGLEGTHWRGTFPSLASLQSGVTDPEPGDYADVDSAGADVERYIWDATDSEWVVQSGAVAPITASQVKLLYESNPDTNAFTGAEKAKLSEAVVTTDPRLTDAREWAAETVGQAEAEAGTATTRRAWTAQRVRQAIVAWWESVSSAWGRGFVASADAGAARTALGLGTAATADAGDFDPAGGAANALSSANSYTDSVVGDIGAALDAINGEVV